METCSECGFEAANWTGLKAHARIKHGTNVTKEEESVSTEPQPRSERGRRRRSRDMQILSPLEQIRAKPGGTTGPWGYYLRPDGATLADAITIYPNGAKLPTNIDPKGHFSANADYYQSRQRARGLEYIGHTLTPEGIRKVIATILANKDDEVLDLEDQIADCDRDIQNSDRPEVRDNQRKRKAKLQRRLEHVLMPIDADALSAELNAIARAQRMSTVSAETLAVMREMIGEQDAKYMKALEKFKSTGSPSESESLEGVAMISE